MKKINIIKIVLLPIILILVISFYLIINGDDKSTFLDDDYSILTKEDRVIYKDENSIIKIKKGVKKYKKLKVNNDDIKLEYKNSRENIKDNKQNLDIYIDSNNDEYMFSTDTNNLVGFLKEKNYEHIENLEFEITKENALDLSNEYLNNKINIKKYKLNNIDYNDTSKRYEIYYNKYINNYKTTDGIFIWISINGDIDAFSFNDSEKFDSLIIPEVNKAKLDEYISNKLEGMDYIIEDVLIDKKEDDELYVVYKILIKYENINEGVYIEIPISHII